MQLYVSKNDCMAYNVCEREKEPLTKGKSIQVKPGNLSHFDAQIFNGNSFILSFYWYLISLQFYEKIDIDK